METEAIMALRSHLFTSSSVFYRLPLLTPELSFVSLIALITPHLDITVCQSQKWALQERTAPHRVECELVSLAL